MLELAPLHSMLKEMHTGTLTLASICILLIIIDKLQLRMRKTSDKQNSFWSTDLVIGKIFRYAEPTAYLAGIFGIIGLITSSIVGMYTWPLELLTTSALPLNKIMFSIFATELWIFFVVLRSKYGEKLWENSSMAVVYTCLGLVGFIFIVISGSLGAYMTGKISVIDPIYALFGIDPATYGVTGFDFTLILISVSIALVVVPMAIVLYLQRKKD
jgi:hypothetical protein